MMDADDKARLEGRLRRVAGQIGGIQRMVAEDRYCVDVLMQISAARAALGKVGRILLESHIQTCVADAFASRDGHERDAKIDELVRVFDRNCGC